MSSLSYKTGFRDGFFEMVYHYRFYSGITPRWLERIKAIQSDSYGLPIWDEYQRGFIKGANAVIKIQAAMIDKEKCPTYV